MTKLCETRFKFKLQRELPPSWFKHCGVRGRTWQKYDGFVSKGGKTTLEIRLRFSYLRKTEEILEFFSLFLSLPRRNAPSRSL